MKKILAILFSATMLFSAIASATEVKTTSTVSEQEPAICIGLPNPFIDHKTLRRAEKTIGFNISVPKSINCSTRRVYRTGADLLEIIYFNGDNEVARIRKAQGCKDISGDYTIYSAHKRITNKDSFYDFRGVDDKIFVTNWFKFGYSYSLSTTGMTQAETEAILQQID